MHASALQESFLAGVRSALYVACCHAYVKECLDVSLDLDHHTAWTPQLYLYRPIFDHGTEYSMVQSL